MSRGARRARGSGRVVGIGVVLFVVAGAALLVHARSHPGRPPAVSSVGTTPVRTASAAPTPRTATTRATTPAPPRATPAPVRSYVALGDSYAAALGVGRYVTGRPCYRSDRNYAALLARRLDLRLDDATCSSAYLTSLWQRQAPGVAPQLDALGADTDLVTLQLGMNDLHLMQTAVSCLKGRPSCRSAIDRVGGRVPALTRSLDTAITQIRARSPRARILLISYPYLVGDQGAACAGARIGAPVARELNAAWKRLSTALEQARTRYGLPPVVEMGGPSEGHDICSRDPWVAGIHGGGALPLHPVAREQEAVADAVAAALG